VDRTAHSMAPCHRHFAPMTLRLGVRITTDSESRVPSPSQAPSPQGLSLSCGSVEESASQHTGCGSNNTIPSGCGRASYGCDDRRLTALPFGEEACPGRGRLDVVIVERLIVRCATRIKQAVMKAVSIAIPFAPWKLLLERPARLRLRALMACPCYSSGSPSTVQRG
jgi:hypothetical protein